MGFYTNYKAIFTKVASLLGGITGATVLLAGPFRWTHVPILLINPLDDAVTKGSMDLYLDNINFEVICIIRETTPNNWFDDVIAKMGAVRDKIVADQTLSGACIDCYPTAFIPGEIHIKSKLYYGGVVRFRAEMLGAL